MRWQEGTTYADVVEAARNNLAPDAMIDRVRDEVSDEDAVALAYEELDTYRAERDAS